MADKIQLEIVTPRGRALSVSAEEVTAPSVDGEFGVMPGHLPLLAALRTGLVTYRVGGETKKCAVGPGFVEAGPDKVSIVTDEFTERDAIDPVLVPSSPVDPKTLPLGEHPPFDEASVEDPLLLPRVDPTGELQVRVLYTGYAAPPSAAARSGAIGFAARYGDAGRLSRQAAPVYAAPGSTASGPALLSYAGGTLLYVSQLDTTEMPETLAVAAAFDPVAGGPPTLGAYPADP